MHEALQGWLRGADPPPPVIALIGIRLLEAGEGTARLDLEAGPRHHNPMRTVHGGVFCDLADAAMGVAMAGALAEGESFTTLDLTIHYLRAVREERLTAEAALVRRGRATAYLECTISGADGAPVARAAAGCLIFAQRSEQAALG